MDDIQFRWMGKNLEYRIQRTKRITSGSYDLGSISGYNETSWSSWAKVPRCPVRRSENCAASTRNDKLHSGDEESK